MKASDLFIKCLETEGVQYIFGVPGEENLDLLESIRTSEKIQFITTRHEQAAAFMAATHGRLTGKPGVVLSTLGPGATNLVTGIAYAQNGGMPLVAITGQKPIKNSTQGRFQLIDTIKLMSPVTKSSLQLDSADRIPTTIHNAFKLATQERPGATHIELPEDIAQESTDALPIHTTGIRRPSPDPKALNKAVELIQQAERPLIMIASGANRTRISTSLTQLIEKTGIFFFTTQMGKGVVDESHPRYLGCAAVTHRDYIHSAIDRADLIISIGHDTYEKPPSLIASGGKKLINFNFSPAEVDDVFVPTHEVVGDIANSLQILGNILQKSPNWNFRYFKQLKNWVKKHLDEKAEHKGFPIIPQKFAYDLRKALPKDAIVALDNGLYKLWMARNYPAYKPNTLLLDNALATMGAGLSSAIAAKLLYPNRKIVAVCGDGGFMMNSQELETAVRLKLDLTVIILNDDAYGMIKWKQSEARFPRYAMDYGNPNFVKYAKSYGAKGYKLKNLSQLVPKLQKMVKSKGVNVIEVEIDYSRNYEFFSDEQQREVNQL